MGKILEFPTGEGEASKYIPEYAPRLSLYLLLSLATPKKSYSA